MNTTHAHKSEPLGLAGKVAIVTGGGSGIGEATALRLGSQGVSVVVADINEQGGNAVADKIRDAGGAAVFQRCDISSEEDAAALAKRALDTYGGLHLAANVAGVGARHSPIVETAVEDFDLAYRVNQRGMFLCLRAELAAMVGPGCSIVNVASTAALRAFNGLSGYVSSKHGALGLSANAASENVARGVRVNCVAPGSTMTPMMLALDSSALDAIAAAQPMGRLADPAEIAAVIVFLLSEDASYVTGAVVPVDGGWLAFNSQQ